MATLVEFPEEIFSAMQRIRETALVRFDSLFTPERHHFFGSSSILAEHEMNIV
jgi:hypothetical protein